MRVAWLVCAPLPGHDQQFDKAIILAASRAKSFVGQEIGNMQDRIICKDLGDLKEVRKNRIGKILKLKFRWKLISIRLQSGSGIGLLIFGNQCLPL